MDVISRKIYVKLRKILLSGALDKALHESIIETKAKLTAFYQKMHD